MMLHYSRVDLFLFFLMLTELTKSLKLLELQVPGHVQLGARTHLMCLWALSPSEHLYSVKWYKDGKEFFRHVPKNQEPWSKYYQPGVEVQDFSPSGSNLTLSPVTLESSGRYRCEVSGEKPLFATVSDHADMEVIVVPDQGPVLSGLRRQYKIGDRVEVKCTSGRSQPATQLGWYINGEPAPVMAAHRPTYHNDSQGLTVTSVILNLVVTEKHFIDNRLKIKCLATLFPFYWRSNEESAMKQRNVSSKQSRMKSTVAVTINDPILINQIRSTVNNASKLVLCHLFLITLPVLLQARCK